MKPVLIHIGFHKTGTTWLQKQLFAHKSRGFQALQHPDYPDKGDAKSVGWAFTNTDSRIFDADKTRQTLEEANTIEDGKIAVISNERLSGATISGGYDAMEIARRLKGVFPEAKILIGVREQFSMILSTYQQYLKRGGGHALKCLLKMPAYGPLPSFSVDHFKYDLLVAHYQQLFGTSNVMIYAYEEFKQNPQDVIAKLYDFAGTDMPENLSFSEKHNQSKALFISTVTRQLGPLLASDPANGYSSLAIPWNPEIGKRCLGFIRETIDLAIPESWDEWIIEKQRAVLMKKLGEDYFAKSNQNLEKLTTLDLKALHYPT